MTDYEYDSDLPYVVEGGGKMLARFASRNAAHEFDANMWGTRVIDTTPKPRVPDDAKFITWRGRDIRWYAERVEGGWRADIEAVCDSLEKLPEVYPETVFTVLDERGK